MLRLATLLRHILYKHFQPLVSLVWLTLPHLPLNMQVRSNMLQNMTIQTGQSNDITLCAYVNAVIFNNKKLY